MLVTKKGGHCYYVLLLASTSTPKSYSYMGHFRNVHTDWSETVEPLLKSIGSASCTYVPRDVLSDTPHAIVYALHIRPLNCVCVNNKLV